jgi:hypothetical protein
MGDMAAQANLKHSPVHPQFPLDKPPPLIRKIADSVCKEVAEKEPIGCKGPLKRRGMRREAAAGDLKMIAHEL